MKFSTAFYCRSEFTAPWGLELPAMKDWLMFHVVTSGRCWLEVKGAEHRLLHRGDLALVPHGEGHRLASEPGIAAARLFDLPREQVSERYEILRHGGGGAVTNLVCGAVRFDHPAAHHLIKVLPGLICVEAWNSPQMDWIQSILRFGQGRGGVEADSRGASKRINHLSHFALTAQLLPFLREATRPRVVNLSSSP